MTFVLIAGGVVALGAGVWLGVGAPGWPHKPQYRRRHDTKRAINPIGRGRSTSGERRSHRSRREARRR